MRQMWNRETAIWAFLAVAILLTAAVGQYNVRRMEASERVLQITRATHADLSALLADMIEAETGHRGYILTGLDEYFVPFREANERVQDRLTRLQDQVSAYPIQAERLEVAAGLIQEKFTEMRRTLAIRDQAGRDAAATGIAQGRGKQIMDQFRDHAKEMILAEEERLALRAVEVDQHYRTAEFTNVMAAVLSIGILAGLAILARREAQQRARLAAKLASSKVETDDALGRLDAFLRHAPYGIAYFDPDLRFIRVNDMLAREHGVPIREHLGRSLTDVIPEYPADLLADYRRVLETDHGFTQRLVHGSGLVWEVTAFAVPDAVGRRGLGLIGLNVTDRQRQEEQLRQSEARFRTLTETMPQIVWTSAPDGAIEYFNSRWYEYTGLTPDTSLGWLWKSTIHPEDSARAMTRWAEAIVDGAPFEIEYRFRRQDGEYEWFLGRSLPLRDDGGSIVRWLGTCTGIDEHVRISQALRDSEARFRELADAMPQIVYATDPIGRVTFINQRWIDYTGQADSQSADMRPLIPPEELNEMQNRWKAAVSTSTPFEAEFPLLGQDGKGYRWFLTRAIPIRGEDGQVVRWYGTSTDIHEQKRIQQEIRDAASQLRQLTEGMPLLMWACRADGACDYLSRQWVEYTGVGLEGQLGLRWLETLHPEDRVGTEAAWQYAVQESGEYDIEFRLRRHDGQYRWFAVRGIPLRDHAGRIVRWYGSCTDIDDRKRQSATLEKMVTERTATLHRTNVALREQQIFLDAILNNVAEGIVACDAEGRLKLFNAATIQMHGLPSEPLPPDQWAEHYRLFEADGVTPMLANHVPLLRAWQGEVVRDAELMIRTPNGFDRYVLCSGVQLQTADGNQFGAVVSMRDMTERRDYERQLLVTAAALKEANRALQESNEALKLSNNELEKFAYIASHDLQEPLRKIQAFGTRLASKHRDVLGEQGQDYIDRMLDSAGRMRKLIEDLLSFSRVASKPVSFSPVDLNTVVSDVLKDLELRVQQSGGRVEVGPLPSLRGDASQLRQVFQNLIGNALKFANTDVPPVVHVIAVPFDQLPPDAEPASPRGDGYRITVEDNGIGFEQEYTDRIFELFQRLHARVEYEGTGLGLAIVRKIILRHGATITARGKPGKGATFLIDWPLRTTLTT